MGDGTQQRPGSWNRFTLEVSDVETTVTELCAAGVSFRSGIVAGIGGGQAPAEDPSGNLVELCRHLRPEAHEQAAFRAP